MVYKKMIEFRAGVLVKNHVKKLTEDFIYCLKLRHPLIRAPGRKIGIFQR
jgi:hypothetical protein